MYDLIELDFEQLGDLCEPGKMNELSNENIE